MSIVRSLVNAEVLLENGNIKKLFSGYNYETTKAEMNIIDHDATIYFKDGIAKNVDSNAFEFMNTPVEFIYSLPPQCSGIL